jgi:DNA-directed RNA polymerase specialized sigma24 family protein
MRSRGLRACPDEIAHAPSVHRYAARRLGEQTADDVVAETFLAAFRLRERYDTNRPDVRPRPNQWIYTKTYRRPNTPLDEPGRRP